MKIAKAALVGGVVALAGTAWALGQQSRVQPPAEAAASAAAKPADAVTDAQVAAARKRAMAILTGVPKGGKMMVAQELGEGHNAAERYVDYVDGLTSSASGTPAVVGVNYIWDVAHPDHIKLANATLIKHWKRGGLVTVAMHPGNPFNGGDNHNRDGVDYAELLRTGSAPNQRFGKDLDAVAAGLKELRDAGVVVVFRPLHEANGKWFWWNPAGREPTEEARKGYVALYRGVYEYLTKDKKLDNLLFAWTPNMPDRWGDVEPADRYYPGDDVVDLVGLDLYDDLWDDAAMGSGAACAWAAKTGKPLVWEVGPQNQGDGSFDARKVTAALKKHCPNTAYFMFWNGWPLKGPFGVQVGYKNMALTEISGGKDVVADPAVVTLEKLAAAEKAAKRR